MKSIPPFKLLPEPLSVEAKKLSGFKWADEIIGNRHKLGGTPDFLQNEKWPECTDCGEKMTFYCQLDSIGDDICIADCGLLYVFLCFDCYTTHAIIQSG